MSGSLSRKQSRAVFLVVVLLLNVATAGVGFTQTASAHGSTAANASVSVAATTVKSGESTTYEVTVANTGSSRDTFVILPADSPSDWTVDDQQFDGNNNKKITLDPGESGTREFTVTAGSTSKSGLVKFDVFHQTSCGWLCTDTFGHYITTVSGGHSVDADAPSISNVRTEYDGTEVTVKADVDDSSGVSTVDVTYDTGYLDTGTTVEMTKQSGDTYSATFDLSWGQSFEYDVYAEDDLGNADETSNFDGQVPTDNTGPSVSVVDVAVDGKEVTVTAKATDSVSGVDDESVTLHWDTGLTDFFGSSTSMESVGGGYYEASFDVDYGETFSYEVSANDNAGNGGSDSGDDEVPRGTLEVEVENDDDEDKEATVLVDGNERTTLDVPSGQSATESVTVDPVTHDVTVEWEEQDRGGESFSHSSTVTVPQQGTETESFDIGERLAPEIELDCSGSCDFGTYNPDDGRPEIRIDVTNVGGGAMDWQVVTASAEVVEKGDDYIVVKPYEGEVGEFSRTVDIMVMNDRYEGEGHDAVTLTGQATIEPEKPDVEFSSWPSSIRQGLEGEFTVFVEEGSAGTPDQPEPSAPEEHVVTWYVDGEKVTETEASLQSDGAMVAHAALKQTFSEPGTHTVKAIAKDPNTGKTDTVSKEFTVGRVDGEIVGYQSPAADTTYKLDTWYTVRVEVKNTGDYTHTYQVAAANPSGTELKERTKNITLEAGESGVVEFEQQFYGVYTQTRGFSHTLSKNADDDDRPLTAVDESTLTLERPPAGDLTVAFNDGQGNDVDAQFQLRNADGEVVRDSYGERIYRNLPAGTYTLVTNEQGHIDRSNTFTLQPGTDKTVTLSLPPEETGASIVDGSFGIVDPQSSYGAGDVVESEVTVKNTGNRNFTFFVGYSARDESGVMYDNAGQTGKHVDLEAGETRTVTLRWTVPPHAPNGSYDLFTSVWFDYPEEGETPIDSAEPLEGEAAVAQEREEALSDPLKSAIQQYKTAAEPKVGVAGPRVYDGERYRAAVYFGQVQDVAFDGIQPSPASMTVLRDSEQWDRLNTSKVLVFRATGDGYELVRNETEARHVLRTYAPGGFSVSDPRQSGNENLADDEFNDLKHPSEEELQQVNNLLENEVFIQQQITKSWVESDYDKYLVVVRAMASTGSKSLIPEALREQLTDAQSIAGAVSIANGAIQDADKERIRKVLELYIDNVQRLDSVAEYGGQATVVLDWVLRFSEYQVYSDGRIEMMETALNRAAENPDVSLDPSLRRAMQTVIGEHEDLQQKMFNRFKEFLVEKGEAKVISIAKKGSKVFAKKVGTYLVTAVSQHVSGQALSGLTTIASGIAAQVMAGITISNFLYNMDGMYEAGLKAKWAFKTASQLDAVADEYRADHLGAGTYRELDTYRQLNSIHFHAMSVFYEGRSGVLNATWVDDAKDEIYTSFGLSNGWTIEDARQRYIENARVLEELPKKDYRPETIDVAVQSIPQSGTGPILTVDDTVNVGEFSGETTVTRTVTNDGEATLSLDSVVTPDGITGSVDASSLGPGETATLTLTVNASAFSGEFGQTIYLHSNSEASPRQLRVSGTALVAPPSAALAAATENVAFGETVAFDASGSNDPADRSLRFEWDLDGDGEFTDATGPVSELTLDEPGATTVAVRVTNGERTDTAEVTVTVDEPAEPAPSLTAEPETVDAGDAVTLNASGSTDPNALPLEYVWDLDGDGEFDDGQGATVTVEFPTAGEREPTVRVSNGYTSATKSVVVTVNETDDGDTDAPVARLTANVSTAGEDEPVFFDASQSTGTDLTYAWDLDGDGEFGDADGSQSLSVAFGSSGTRTVAVRVSDGETTSNASAAVTIEDEPNATNSPPIPALSANTTTVTVGEAVRLSAAGSTDPDGDALSYSWDLDRDGTAEETGPTVRHAFNEPGDHVVTLTVSDGTTTTSENVTVSVHESTGSPVTAVGIGTQNPVVANNGTVTVPIVIDAGEGGIGAYSVSLDVSSPSRATIANVTLRGDPGQQDVQVRDGSATMDVALAGFEDSGRTVVAAVTLTGVEAGETSLNVSVDAVGTTGTAGEVTEYDVAETNNATLSVIDMDPVGPFEGPPTDPDNDGVFEDVNGNGEFTLVDVQALFAHRESDVVLSHPKRFDVTGDGRFNVVDVQALFKEATDDEE